MRKRKATLHQDPPPITDIVSLLRALAYWILMFFLAMLGSLQEAPRRWLSYSLVFVFFMLGFTALSSVVTWLNFDGVRFILTPFVIAAAIIAAYSYFRWRNSLRGRDDG